MTGRYHVYIIEVDGQARVRPAVASVDRQREAQLTIRNLTNYKWLIAFDPRMVQPGNRTVRIAPGKHIDVPLSKSKKGFFTYTVTRPGGTRKKRDFIHAHGESAPIMILDP